MYSFAEKVDLEYEGYTIINRTLQKDKERINTGRDDKLLVKQPELINRNLVRQWI